MKQKNLKKQLIEYYKNRGKEDLKIVQEWENTSLLKISLALM